MEPYPKFTTIVVYNGLFLSMDIFVGEKNMKYEVTSIRIYSA